MAPGAELRAVPRLLALGVLLLAACEAPGPGFGRGSAGDDDDTAQEQPGPPTQHPLLGADPPGFDVFIGAASYSCDDGRELPQGCTGELELAIQQLHGGPVDAACVEQRGAELLALADAARTQGVDSVAAASSSELAALVRGALSVDLMQSAQDVVVEVGPAQQRDGYTYIDLVLRDGLLGSWPAALLVPFGEGPRPGVVMLPGHPGTIDGQETSAIIDTYGTRNGRLLAQHGFVVLITSFRAYDAGPAETGVSLQAACGGTSLAALHGRNAELARRFLEGSGLVDSLAVMGHSGGSVTALLAGAWSSWDAVVIDHFTRWFLDVSEGPEGLLVLSGVLPELASYAACLYEGSDVEGTLEGDATLPWPPCARSGAMPPHLGVPYVVDNSSSDEVVDFLASSLE